MSNNFFNDSNKAYSENLNDGILVGNAFDWTVEVSLPTDTDGVFPNSSTIVMAKVADVYATPNTNLSIGSTIENSSGSSQVYRLTVYPNFNRFGGFTFVSLEGDGSVIITEKGGTSPVRNNLDYTNLGNVTELKTLKEYDIVVTIPSRGVVTGLSFGFKSSSADVTASINQSNVTGLESDLSGIRDDLSSLESGKADAAHTHFSREVRESSALSNIGTKANALQSVVNGAVNGKVGSLSTSISNNLSKINTLNTEVWGSNTQTGNSRIDNLNTNYNNLRGSITNLESSVASLDTSITNLNTRVKSGKVTGISVQKQNVGSYTVTHNLGRPNVPVATLDLGDSNGYDWANTQISVYNITNNNFKVTIYNNAASKGSFSFNWVVVATD